MARPMPGSVEWRMATISCSLGDWRPIVRDLGDGPQNQVALTIDDAPCRDTTPELLACLQVHGARATFFISGFRAEGNEDILQAITGAGHAMYAHGWDHVRLDREPIARLKDDMSRCEDLLSKFRPMPRPYLVRLPYNGGYRSARIHRALADWSPGCQIAHWRLSMEDHDFARRFPTRAEGEAGIGLEVDRVLRRRDLARSVILLHDQPINELPNGGHKAWLTIETVRRLLEGLSARGFRSVALSPMANPSLLSRFVFA
jgi:peptidoglycan-N-acetylglucosamine deacetylase